MNPYLIQAVAESRRQELLQQAGQHRWASECPRRPSALARWTSAISSVSLVRRRSAEPRRAAPAAVDA